MTSSEISDLSSELVNSLDENGELPFPKRRWLQAELRQSVVTAKSDLAWLASEVISAHKVEHIWRERLPLDSAPIDLLGLADNSLNDDTQTEALRQLFPKVKTLLDDRLALGDQYFRAVYAGFACWAAAGGVKSGAADLNGEGASELEVDPELWDACFYASLAWAGGAVWEEEIDDQGSRREFWTWYANEAVPQAITFAQQQ